MSFRRLLAQVAAVTRPTATLVDGATFPFTMALTRQDSQGVFVRARGIGLTSGVTLSITGTVVNGLTTSTELLTLAAGNPVQRSGNRWTSLTQIASVSASAGKVVGTAVYGSGQDAVAETVVEAAQRGRLQLRETPRQVTGVSGTEVAEEWLWFTESRALQPDDVLLIDGVRYEVTAAPPVYDARRFHHTEAILQRLN